jgi:hypothetical protein
MQCKIEAHQSNLLLLQNIDLNLPLKLKIFKALLYSSSIKLNKQNTYFENDEILREIAKINTINLLTTVYTEKRAAIYIYW